MAKTKTSADEQLSTVQVAAELGISKVRVIVLINQGRIPATRIGNIWVIRRGDLEPVRNRPTGRPRTKKPEEKKPKPKRG